MCIPNLDVEMFVDELKHSRLGYLAYTRIEKKLMIRNWFLN